MPVIVVSGKPGCGSSTVAKLLAKRLGLRRFSLGSYFKKHVARTKSHFVSLDKKQTVSQPLHKNLDAVQIKLAKKGNIVIDSKLGIRMLGKYADIRIWLKADTATIAKRLAKQEKIPLSAAVKQIKERHSDERKAFRKIYGFDTFSQEKLADIVINTSNKRPEEIIDLIVSKLRRVFVVHRWAAMPKSDWYPYVKGELEKKGYFVTILKMPDTNRPQLSKWLPHLAEAVGMPTANTFLVGHSAGVATILHYLEQLKNEKVGGCVLVAGWIDDMGYKQLSSFVDRPFDWAKIRKHCRKFIVIHSDNDPYVKLYHGRAFQKQLKAKLITERGKGHLDDDSKVKELDSVMQAIEGIKNEKDT